MLLFCHGPHIDPSNHTHTYITKPCHDSIMIGMQARRRVPPRVREGRHRRLAHLPAARPQRGEWMFASRCMCVCTDGHNTCVCGGETCPGIQYRPSHKHTQVDEPAFTNPLTYARVRDPQRQTPASSYIQRLVGQGLMTRTRAEVCMYEWDYVIVHGGRS